MAPAFIKNAAGILADIWEGVSSSLPQNEWRVTGDK
jgi:hypothetical protein